MHTPLSVHNSKNNLKMQHESGNRTTEQWLLLTSSNILGQRGQDALTNAARLEARDETAQQHKSRRSRVAEPASNATRVLLHSTASLHDRVQQ